MAGSKENHLLFCTDGILPNIMSNPQLLASASAQTFHFDFSEVVMLYWGDILARPTYKL